MVEELALEAEARLRRLGYANVEHPGRATARAAGPSTRPSTRSSSRPPPTLVPPALVEQLRPGGRMVLPTGLSEMQRLTVVEKDAAGEVELRELMDVRFTSLETV